MKMLQKFEIRGDHTTVDKDLQKYVTRKLGSLDKYLSRHTRKTAHAKINLKESIAKDKQNSTCEVTLQLPHETINVKESALNMYAAIDIVEAKLKNQIKKYKELHQSGKMHRKLFARLSRRTPAPIVISNEI